MEDEIIEIKVGTDENLESNGPTPHTPIVQGDEYEPFLSSGALVNAFRCACDNCDNCIDYFGSATGGGVSNVSKGAPNRSINENTQRRTY